jgi:hypothetical protein
VTGSGAAAEVIGTIENNRMRLKTIIRIIELSGILFNKDIIIPPLKWKK